MPTDAERADLLTRLFSPTDFRRLLVQSLPLGREIMARVPEDTDEATFWFRTLEVLRERRVFDRAEVGQPFVSLLKMERPESADELDRCFGAFEVDERQATPDPIPVPVPVRLRVVDHRYTVLGAAVGLLAGAGALGATWALSATTGASRSGSPASVVATVHLPKSIKEGACDLLFGKGNEVLYTIEFARPSGETTGVELLAFADIIPGAVLEARQEGEKLIALDRTVDLDLSWTAELEGTPRSGTQGLRFDVPQLDSPVSVTACTPFQLDMLAGRDHRGLVLTGVRERVEVVHP